MDVSFTKVVLRFLNPVRLATALRSSRRRDGADRRSVDPELKLYRRVLDGGRLHYGYFEEPERKGEEISLADLRDAQAAYSDLLLRQLPDHDRPVLDCGCGTGSFLDLLSEHGFDAVGLTPDPGEYDLVRRTHGERRIRRSRFEDLDVERHADAYGAVVCAESLQYLDLPRAFEVAEAILAPGGRWIICDYFRKHDQTHEASGHLLDDFHHEVERYGWSIARERDVTENLVGTLRFLHALAGRIAPPLLEFLRDKISAKRPVLHDLFREELDALEDRLEGEMKTIDPEQFLRDKTYRLFVLEQG